MPTMPERMATVETKVTYIETTVGSMDRKLDILLSERDEARGARQQRASFNKKVMAAVMALSTIVSAGVGFIADAFFRSPGGN